MKINLTKERLASHFRYDLWKYAAMLASTLVLLSLIFTITAPKVPAELKVDVHFASSGMGMEQEVLDALGAEILASFPDQQQINVYNVPVLDNVAADKLFVMLSTQEGDVYILSRTDFNRYAPVGALYPLDEALAAGTLKLPEGCKPLRSQPDEPTPDIPEAAYGIEISGIPGLSRIGYFEMDGAVICIVRNTQNLSHSLGVIQWILDNFSK